MGRVKGSPWDGFSSPALPPLLTFRALKPSSLGLSPSAAIRTTPKQGGPVALWHRALRPERQPVLVEAGDAGSHSEEGDVPTPIFGPHFA